MRESKRLYVYSDGGSRGNPGPSALGVVILNEAKKQVASHKKFIGRCTNNQAEYKAAIRALEIAASLSSGEISCYIDSELVVRQLNGIYRIKNEKLKNLHKILKEREKPFEKVTYTHVKRTNPYIKKADRLVNEALDSRLKIPGIG